MAWTPLSPPSEPGQLAEYLARELSRLSIDLVASRDFFQLNERNSAPTKPKHGMIVLADGTNWNPGSGKGIYWYDSAGPTWEFLG